MKSNRSIKVRAVFLLTVFSINTVVAFACSLGLNMGYNQKHHEEKTGEKMVSTQSHHHTPGIKSNHHSPAQHGHEDTPKLGHSLPSTRSHDNAAAHQCEQGNTGQDDCCTGNAVKFQAEDKKIQPLQDFAIKLPVFVAFLSAFLGLDLAPLEAIAGNKFHVPQVHPPPDIRIAIQSFLI